MSTKHCKFKIGDLVRLVNGHTEMIVHDIKMSTFEQPTIYASYVDCPTDHVAHRVRYRSENDYVMWEGDPRTNKTRRKTVANMVMPQICRPYQNHENYFPMKGITQMNTLYQTHKKKVRYGTYLTKNSQGQIVLEMKGKNGACEAFDENAITEVTPYTFGVVACNDSSHMPHYVGIADCVAKGDILMSNSGNIYRVINLDTKCKSPKRVFRGVKLATTPIISE